MDSEQWIDRRSFYVYLDPLDQRDQLTANLEQFSYFSRCNYEGVKCVLMDLFCPLKDALFSVSNNIHVSWAMHRMMLFYFVYTKN